MADIEYRNALTGDINAIDAINRSCLPENYDLGCWLMMLLYGDHNFVACVGGEVVGYVVTVNNATNPHVRRMFDLPDDRCSVLSFAILPAYRRKGIGRKLLGLTLDSIKAGETIELCVRESNTVARKLYESVGFTLEKTIEGYYPESASMGLQAENGLKMVYLKH